MNIYGKKRKKNEYKTKWKYESNENKIDNKKFREELSMKNFVNILFLILFVIFYILNLLYIKIVN